MPESVKFTTTTGEPMIIHVTDKDGSRYELKLQFVILDVVKLALTSAGDEVPMFQAKASLVTQTTRVSP
jgi:hypothetical protein